MMSSGENNSGANATSTELVIKKGVDKTHSPIDDATIPKMGKGRPYPPLLYFSLDYEVTFEDADPTNPQQFLTKKKLRVIAPAFFLCLCSVFGSAVFSEATDEILKKFNVGLEVSTLCTSLFVLGYAPGPVIWGPLSELYGRKTVLVSASLGYMLFNFAVATAKDIQAIIICRFFAGFMSTAPMVIASAKIADVCSHRARGYVVSFFSMILFEGPMLAPIISGFIVKNKSLGWRWCSYILGIMCSVAFIMLIFLYEETHAGVILAQKAHVIRQKTGNWSIYANHERSVFSLRQIVTKVITRPIRMLFREQILSAVAIYFAFIFGILYLFLTTIPVIYGAKGYNFSQGVAQLPYISIMLGVITGGLVNMVTNKRYIRIMKQAGGLVPEERLLPMMLGAIVFPLGLFWLAWGGQNPDKVHWIVPTIALFPVGFGLICIFLPALSYMLECYLPYAASATSANTMLRYSFGAVFPLFSRQMYDKLHVNWGTSLLAFVALVLMPVPFMFYKYGKLLRSKSPYCYKN